MTVSRSISDLDREPDRGLSRRDLLTRSASAGAGIILSGSIPGLFGVANARRAGPAVGFGPLIPDPAGVLSLPQGFTYEIVARSGETLLDSGDKTPDDPDGTAAFVRRGGNGSVLVNNHEIGGEPNRVPALEGFTYDPLAGGATTNIEVDRDGTRVREYVSLAGTHNNCAGGQVAVGHVADLRGTESSPPGSTMRHGYVFEVDPHDLQANRDPKPIKAMGRYAHESLAVDPHTHTIYMTEDAGGPNGLLYRWTPPERLGKGALRALPDDAGTLALHAVTMRGDPVPDHLLFA